MTTACNDSNAINTCSLQKNSVSISSFQVYKPPDLMVALQGHFPQLHQPGELTVPKHVTVVKSNLLPYQRKTIPKLGQEYNQS